MNNTTLLDLFLVQRSLMFMQLCQRLIFLSSNPEETSVCNSSGFTRIRSDKDDDQANHTFDNLWPSEEIRTKESMKLVRLVCSVNDEINQFKADQFNEITCFNELEWFRSRVPQLFSL